MPSSARREPSAEGGAVTARTAAARARSPRSPARTTIRSIIETPAAR
ncbi:hypothetical protein ACFPFX_14400 [Streptomyces mauvecolor]|uniref:Uncharacterized protein n=1 Tax=Streptomyces mauvecolor TaxID=58345 RepID=A0ABV9UM02_9ACTN